MEGLAYTWTNIVTCLGSQRITLLNKLATCLRVGYCSLSVKSIATNLENITNFNDYGRLQILFCISIHSKLFSNDKKHQLNLRKCHLFYLKCFMNMSPGLNLRKCHRFYLQCFYEYGLWLTGVTSCAFVVVIGLQPKNGSLMFGCVCVQYPSLCHNCLKQCKLAQQLP